MTELAQVYGIDVPRNRCEVCGHLFVTPGDETVCSDCREGQNDDAKCSCGHPLYLHDDGADKCVECSTCERFERPKPRSSFDAFLSRCVSDCVNGRR